MALLRLQSSSFNPTLVRFERASAAAASDAACRVSIPHWSDLSLWHACRTSELRMYGFNPTLVRFERDGLDRCDADSVEFQSHIGPI